MTAINLLIQRYRATMMTDASMYTPHGVIVGFGDKAIAMPSLKAAIACRGNQKATGILAMQFSINYATFDELIENVAEDVRDWHDDMVAHLARYGFQDIDFLAIGWSDSRNRPLGCAYESRTDSFEVIEEIALAPMPDMEILTDLARRGCSIADTSRLDPVKHGIQIMEAQRRMKVFVSDVGEDMHIIGGHLVLTEVTKDGVSQRIVHRWNDKVGEPIDPMPEPIRAQASPASLTLPGLPMSRQQRRAAESEARKGRQVA